MLTDVERNGVIVSARQHIDQVGFEQAALEAPLFVDQMAAMLAAKRKAG